MNETITISERCTHTALVAIGRAEVRTRIAALERVVSTRPRSAPAVRTLVRLYCARAAIDSRSAA